MNEQDYKLMCDLIRFNREILQKQQDNTFLFVCFNFVLLFWVVVFVLYKLNGGF